MQGLAIGPPGGKGLPMTARKFKVRTLLAGGAILALTAVAAPAANAGLLVKSAQGCNTQQYSKPFSKFGDLSDYTPIPGGSFEKGNAAWTTTGGAKVVSGNETFKVGSPTDSNSIYIPQGATVTSPSMCVGIDHPTARWFAKSSGTLLGLTGSMTVSVLFEDSLGQTLEL